MNKHTCAYLYVSSDLHGSLSHSPKEKIPSREALSKRLFTFFETTNLADSWGSVSNKLAGAFFIQIVMNLSSKVAMAARGRKKMWYEFSTGLRARIYTQNHGLESC